MQVGFLGPDALQNILYCIEILFNFLAQEIEKNLDTIQDVLQSVRSEKADLHSMVATVESERSYIHGAMRSLEDLKSGMDEVKSGYDVMKKKVDDSLNHEKKLDEYA